MLCDIIDKEPSNYEEVAGWKEWKDAMIEEYQSIVKNDVWDVVPRLEGKSVVTSKWIYKIKHATDGSIEKMDVCSLLFTRFRVPSKRTTNNAKAFSLAELT